MKPFLFNFFHNETNDLSEHGMVHISKDPKEWPESWSKIEYKKYSLFNKIPLPEKNGELFEKFLKKRRSSEGHILQNVVSGEALSYVLRCGDGVQDKNHGDNRTAPSGGKRYPLEMYVFIFKRIDDFSPGIYHYSILSHALEPIIYKQLSREEIISFAPPQEWLAKTSAMVSISSVFHRTTDKYGSRGYRYILLEAGHVAQNMLLAGTEMGINIIPIGGTNAANIETAIGLGTSHERVIYSLYM